MNKDSKIFIAGGSGMVGSAIIRRLIGAGYGNLVASFHARPAPEDLSPGPGTRLAWVPLDLTRQAETEAFFECERPEYVFLAAARVGGILANSTYRAEFIYENMAIAANVVESARRFGTTKLLNLGSSCIYPREAPQPMTEDCLLTGALEETNEPYAIAKIAAIKLCRYYNERYGTDFISLMPTNLYGSNDNFDLETSHVLPALMRKFHLAKLLSAGDVEGIRRDFLTFGNARVEGPAGLSALTPDSPAEDVVALLARFGIIVTADPQHFLEAPSRASDPPLPVSDPPSVLVSLWGTGAPRREFLHVDDLADVALFLMERHSYPSIGEFVNVGTGTDLTIAELARTVAGVVGYEGAVAFDGSKPDGMPRKLLDISRLTGLGWLPRISLEEGLGDAYAWYRRAVGKITA